jgi:hypothetical protein
MYELFLALHSWIRWAALAAGLIATLSALTSRPSAGQPDASDKWGMIFTICLDIQMLLGLAMYFGLSPNSRAILADFGAAMQDPVARFWAVEHIGMMIVVVALAHIGRVLARKATTPSAKRTRLLLCFGLATLLMVVAIPWPGLRAGRPLFRM